MTRQSFRKLSPVVMMLISVLFITVFIGSVPTDAGTGKTVRVSTEKALNKAVKDKSVTSIIFRTEAYIKVTIKANKAATSKDLTIDAPNADITNKSTFSGIFVESSGNYVEAADGNTFEVYDTYAVKSFTVAKKKSVKSLTYINPEQDLQSCYTLRNGAKIEELTLIYSAAGNVGYGVYDQGTRTIEFNYVNAYDAKVSLTYVLDKSGRITTFKNNHAEFGCEYYYEYDENGNLTKENFDDMIGKCLITYEYTSDLKLAKKTQTSEIESFEFSYNYDKKGNLISVERKNKKTGKTKTTVKYTYDKKGRITSCKDTSSGTTVEKYKYDKNGFLTSFSTHTKGGAITEYKHSVSYKYNKAGDIIQKTETTNGYKTVNKYSYDEFGYLK